MVEYIGILGLVFVLIMSRIAGVQGANVILDYIYKKGKSKNGR